LSGYSFGKIFLISPHNLSGILSMVRWLFFFLTPSLLWMQNPT
jgi:hypothetical protein